MPDGKIVAYKHNLYTQSSQIATTQYVDSKSTGYTLLYKGIHSQSGDIAYNFDIDISTKHQILFFFDFNYATTGNIDIYAGSIQICHAYSYGYGTSTYIARWIINKTICYLDTDSSNYRTSLYTQADISDGLIIRIDNPAQKQFDVSFYVA